MVDMETTHTLTITLETGEAHSFTVSKMPRHWKSWLMHQMPYGTVFMGATFNHTTNGRNAR